MNTICPYCAVVIQGSPIAHIREACPKKPADFDERLKKAGQDVGDAFQVLRGRVRHKKRKETYEEYQARLMWFGKRETPKPTDFDYISDDVLNRTMEGLRRIREERERAKNDA